MMTSFTTEDIAIMEQRFRAQFINSLGGFKSVVLIGTADLHGNTNLAIFNSFFHIGANPPLCGLIFRPDTVPRHTLDNIMQTEYYTVNHINRDIFRQAHQTGARYDKAVSEFDATGLEPLYEKGFAAPYVRQSHLRLAMKKESRIDLPVNGTILLIGRILSVFVPGECIEPDGFVDLEKAGTLTVSGLDCYHSTTRLERLSYPKPEPRG